MAYSTPTNISLAFQTNSDLSDNQFTFVQLDSSGRIGAADGTTAKAVGVLSNVPSPTAMGQYAGTVDLVGVTRVCVGGVYSVNTALVPGSDGTVHGLGMTVADAKALATHITYDSVRAIMLEPSVAKYDIVSCLLVGPQAGVDSTVA